MSMSHESLFLFYLQCTVSVGVEYLRFVNTHHEERSEAPLRVSQP